MLLILLAIFVIISSYNMQELNNLSLTRKTRIYTLLPIAMIIMWDTFQFKSDVFVRDLIAFAFIWTFNFSSTICSYCFIYEDEIF